MSKNKLSFLKTNTVCLSVGFIIMLIAVVLFSLLIGRVEYYERFYPLVTAILLFIPPFIGTRLTIRRFERMLMLTALFQGIASLLVVIAISFVLNGDITDTNRYLTALALMQGASLAAVFMPFKKKKRH